MFDAIELDSDGLSDDTDGGEHSQSLEFVNDVIVTPPTTGQRAEPTSDVATTTVKRNLSNVFDEVAKVQASVPLKKVKIEKE